MANFTPFTISANAELCIYSSPDGVLKLWETSTGTLKQEYTPSSHLSATCTCLSWGPKRQMESPRKKKKKKSGKEEKIEEFDLVAIGTTSGSILLYSVIRGEVQSCLDGGHSEPVNDICWFSSENSIISCSDDHHIVQWDVTTAKVKHKWKADSGSVHSVCLCSRNHLLSAGRSIKLWDMHSHQLLKKFTGHATEVFRLSVVPHEVNSQPENSENLYFLSAALNDRIVNAWHINSSSKDKSAVASFSMPDEPVMLDIMKTTVDEQMILLAVLTKSGQVLIFEHTLNGKLKKPLHPKVTIQIATGGGKDAVPHPIPILGVHFCNDRENSILLVHGNFLKPSFEKVPYNSSESQMVLIREDPTQTSLQMQASLSKIKTPAVSKDVTVLAPATMTPAGPSQVGGKRSKRKSSVSEMNMEERLNAISIEKSDVAVEPPKADSLVRLLTQGLQSNDKKILSSVLSRTNSDTLIRNTVQQLPVQAIVPLVKELTVRMQGSAERGQMYVKWIKTLLTVHTSYLITFPEMVENFSLLYQMMDSRTTMFTKLSHLQGKLDLMLSQITSQENQEEAAISNQKPLLMYQEDSSESDDDMLIDEIIPDRSDTEDNYEDIFASDTEVATDHNSQENGEEEMDSD